MAELGYELSKTQRELNLAKRRAKITRMQTTAERMTSYSKGKGKGRGVGGTLRKIDRALKKWNPPAASGAWWLGESPRTSRKRKSTKKRRRHRREPDLLRW